MKNFLKCQEAMTILMKIYWIFCTIKIFINVLAQVYQDKEIQLFLNKLILFENSRKMMVEQCFVSLNISKNLY